jgi:hypothetical protein
MAASLILVVEVLEHQEGGYLPLSAQDPGRFPLYRVLRHF